MIKKPYNVTRTRVVLDTGIGLAKQSFKDECDINKILEKYRKTGQLPNTLQNRSMYGDFTQVENFQDAMNLVINAQNLFEQLPSKIRSRFGNDPGEFLLFMDDPKNAPEMEKLGLATKPRPSHENVATGSSPSNGAVSKTAPSPAVGEGPKS